MTSFSFMYNNFSTRLSVQKKRLTPPIGCKNILHRISSSTSLVFFTWKKKNQYKSCYSKLDEVMSSRNLIYPPLILLLYIERAKFSCFITHFLLFFLFFSQFLYNFKLDTLSYNVLYIKLWREVEEEEGDILDWWMESKFWQEQMFIAY